MAPKLSYIRDRIVDVFLFAVGMFFEPRYSLARIHATKFSMLVTALDDTCDAYATLREVISLHDAFQSWDLGAMEELPSYMRILYQNMLETVEDIDREMKARGKFGSLQPTIDETKSLMILYLATSKWARAGHVPSFEDYMEVGSSASGLHDFAAYGYISMDDCDQKQLNEWFNSTPKIFEALNIVFRLRNDIVTFEVNVGEVANGVNCYMKQYGVTKEAAVEVLRKMERENYKIMMEEFVSSKAVPRQILVRAVNTARVRYKSQTLFMQHASVSIPIIAQPLNWFFVDEKEPVAHALVEVVEASDVNPSDLNVTILCTLLGFWNASGLSDPYVKGQLGACRFKTKILMKMLSPKWQEEFKIPILTWDSPNILNFEVQDKDRFSDDSLGDCSGLKAGRETICGCLFRTSRWEASPRYYSDRGRSKGGLEGATISKEDMWASFATDDANRGSFSSVVSDKAPRVRDNLEPINIEGQEETGIWVHQPGTEVSQIGEPRKGKSRCVDNNIRGVTLEASTGSNESSSPDENQEWEEGRVRERGGGCEALNRKDVGVKYIVEDRLSGLLTGRSPRGESFGSEDAENKGHMKDVAKSILKHTEKSASHIKHAFSRKGSRKSRDDECSTVPENESVFGSEYPCEYSDDDDVQGIEIHTCL
ncbi:hypothetical protein YC2023_012592 [Brassica napus]